MATIYYKKNREWKKLNGPSGGGGANKMLTIKQNGVTVGTYDGSTETTINLTTATSVSVQKIGNDYY